MNVNEEGVNEVDREKLMRFYTFLRDKVLGCYCCAVELVAAMAIHHCQGFALVHGRHSGRVKAQSASASCRRSCLARSVSQCGTDQRRTWQEVEIKRCAIVLATRVEV